MKKSLKKLLGKLFNFDLKVIYQMFYFGVNSTKWLNLDDKILLYSVWEQVFHFKLWISITKS